tara:strand:- start:145 stop:390 length:246 start_codon:yes stop_codon:yes gene_type:complete
VEQLVHVVVEHKQLMVDLEEVHQEVEVLLDVEYAVKEMMEERVVNFLTQDPRVLELVVVLVVELVEPEVILHQEIIVEQKQ